MIKSSLIENKDDILSKKKKKKLRDNNGVFGLKY